VATAAALLCFGVAGGSRASARRAGQLPRRDLDALYALDRTGWNEKARVK
jgi:hypothetical protein